MTNKKGMTLVEVLVYIVLAGMLLAPVIMLMQNSSVNMARDASNVNLRMSGRELMNLIYDDLRNTGYKLKNFNAVDSVTYIDLAGIAAALSGKTSKADSIAALNAFKSAHPLDSSSFMAINNSKYYDALTVRMGKLSPNGDWLGIDTITYYVNNKSELKRRIDGTTNKPIPPKHNPDSITLANNVDALKFLYSDNLIDWDGNPPITTTNPDGITKDMVQYIKVILVTKDPKKLAASKTTKIKLFDGVDTTFTDQALHERHEIVIPIPNNGLYP